MISSKGIKITDETLGVCIYIYIWSPLEEGVASLGMGRENYLE